MEYVIKTGTYYFMFSGLHTCTTNCIEGATKITNINHLNKMLKYVSTKFEDVSYEKV
jgi:hypothetical protein